MLHALHSVVSTLGVLCVLFLRILLFYIQLKKKKGVEGGALSAQI